MEDRIMPASTQRVALVTGASSGIGAALARDLLGRGWSVFGAARRAGVIDDPAYRNLRVDLADTAQLAIVIDENLGGLVSSPDLRRLALVNNAADVGLLGPMDQVDPAALLKLYAVNVVAPVWLMGWFVRRCRPDVALRIANVSTGAAVRAIPGLGSYGSSKAALRMAGMVLAAELDARGKSDAAIASYEPGVVDTPMQTAVRTSSAEVVPSVDMFVRFARDGSLVSPGAPAAGIADWLESDGRARFSELRHGA
jgi:NAD(P)-dependent dehydrogenase (short-subunit alcohol dehydrogenase family)